MFLWEICWWHKTRIRSWFTRGALPNTMTFTGWTNGLTETSWSSKQRAKSCTSGRKIPCISTCRELPRWERAWKKKTWDFWWTPNWTWTSIVPFPLRELIIFWLHLENQVKGVNPSHLLSTGGTIPAILCPIPGSQYKRYVLQRF